MTSLLAPLEFIAHLSPLLWYAKLAHFQASAASRSATSSTQLVAERIGPEGNS